VGKMKLTELRAELVKRKLPTSGKKSDLQARLEQALNVEKQQHPPIVSSVKQDSQQVSSKPEGNDDEVDVMGEEAEEQGSQKQTNITSSTTTNTTPTPTAASTASTASSTTTPSSSAPTSASTPSVTAAAAASSTPSNGTNTLTQDERKSRRAERFNLSSSPSVDERKRQRAERFKTDLANSSISSSAAAPTKGSLVSDPIKLQRAQRFGLPIKGTSTDSSTPVNAVAATGNDRMQKRVARFGSGGAHLDQPQKNLVWTAEEAEKKRKRSERFGATDDTQKKQKVEST